MDAVAVESQMAKHKGGKGLSKGVKKAMKRLPKGARELVKNNPSAAWCRKLLVKELNPKHQKEALNKGKTQSCQQNLKILLSKRKSPRILVVGDGNFSFSASLINLMNGDLSNVFATCYDSEEVLHQKYSDSGEFIEKVRDSGGTVLFDIDGTRLTTYSTIDPPFDFVIFNFPHVGLGLKDQSENIAANQGLISTFLTSASFMIHPQGRVCVTVKRGAPYDSWGVAVLGRRVPALRPAWFLGERCCRDFIFAAFWRIFSLAEEVEGVRMCGLSQLGDRLETAMDFSPDLFPGFSHRRTAGEGCVGDAEDNGLISKGARTFVFGPDKGKPSTLAAAKKSSSTAHDDDD